MKNTTTVIIGAGQSGLAFSKHLTAHSVDHILLERGEVANSWVTQRWDSLRLLTPNWQTRMPGMAYSGNDPDGYMTATDVAGFIKDYAAHTSAPVHGNTDVRLVSPFADGYKVETTQGDWFCNTVVVASGACNIANVPGFAGALPQAIQSLDLLTYKTPDQIGDGGVLVVGASASGAQLAKEIQAAGRQVTLSVGEHVRLPRVYRGRDICWWMDAIGLMDTHYSEVDDLKRARKVASLQLMGSESRANIDLNSLAEAGVRVVGRLQALDGQKGVLSGGLRNHCALADLKMKRLLQSIDQWIDAEGAADQFEPSEAFADTHLEDDTPLSFDLNGESIKTVIWATGYRPDYSWLQVPVFDRKGAIRHEGGRASDVDGLYVMGLPFMRRRKSSYIDGVGDDAADLAADLVSNLRRRAA
ncbi:MAG: NAD(P)-binding domain-containing protein [Alphaproteobacteria bacterium]|nr:NAD(P)-binding domain-containing protein [Alphaproteobacteria bacterium]